MNENLWFDWLFLLFSDRVSLHSSSCPEILYVGHAGLELTEMCWPLFPEFWNQRYVPQLPSCISLIVLKSGSMRGNLLVKSIFILALTVLKMLGKQQKLPEWCPKKLAPSAHPALLLSLPVVHSSSCYLSSYLSVL